MANEIYPIWSAVLVVDTLPWDKHEFLPQLAGKNSHQSDQLGWTSAGEQGQQFHWQFWMPGPTSRPVPMLCD